MVEYNFFFSSDLLTAITSSWLRGRRPVHLNAVSSETYSKGFAAENWLRRSEVAISPRNDQSMK
jgi:hypothetical protein